jgi:hypothetical protein
MCSTTSLRLSGNAGNSAWPGWGLNADELVKVEGCLATSVSFNLDACSKSTALGWVFSNQTSADFRTTNVC